MKQIIINITCTDNYYEKRKDSLLSDKNSIEDLKKEDGVADLDVFVKFLDGDK